MSITTRQAPVGLSAPHPPHPDGALTSFRGVVTASGPMDRVPEPTGNAGVRYPAGSDRSRGPEVPL